MKIRRTNTSGLPLQARVGQRLEVVFNGFPVPGGHAVRDLLQGSLLLTRRQAAPVGDQFLELLLIDLAGAAATRIGGVFRGVLGRAGILRLAWRTARSAAFGAAIAVSRTVARLTVLRV